MLINLFKVGWSENLHIFWTTCGISMKFSVKIWLTIILKVTKKQDSTFSPKNAFLEKPQGGSQIAKAYKHTQIICWPNVRFQRERIYCEARWSSFHPIVLKIIGLEIKVLLIMYINTDNRQTSSVAEKLSFS